MTNAQIAWIDDNSGRERTASDLGAEFIDVRKTDAAEAVESLLKGPPRPLVILDHILDTAASSSSVFRRGSTIAEAIKEKWPQCPVVGISAADIGAMDLRTKNVYDDLFSEEQLGDHIDYIQTLARGFQRVAQSKPDAPIDLLALLKPPREELGRLEGALPEDVKRSLGDPSMPSRFYRWMQHLTSRPGFLYDELWAATFCGLSIEGFGKMAKLFLPALYEGVFARENQKRWWSSRLADVLYENQQPEHGEMSWDVGRRLGGIRGIDHSKCYLCEDPAPPEVVAFIDANSEERHAVHLKHTAMDPRFSRELYFDDIRLMQGD